MAVFLAQLYETPFAGIAAGIPLLVSVRVDLDGAWIELTFDREVAASALVPASFSVDGGLSFSEPVLQTSPGVIQIPVTPMQTTTYSVTVRAGFESVGGGASQADQTLTFLGVPLRAGKRRFESPHWYSPLAFGSRGPWATRISGSKARIF